MLCKCAGKAIDLLNNKIAVNRIVSCLKHKMVIPCYHPEAVQLFSFCRCKAYVLIPELPAIWHIAFFRYLCFICKKQIDLILTATLLKKVQFLLFVSVKFLIALSSRSLSYSPVTAVMTFKKRVSVEELIRFPTLSSTIFLACSSLCLSCSTAALTIL